MPKIAVIIPFYQEEPGILRRCLASVFGQVLKDALQVAIMIVDDASPVDPTGDIEAAGHPPRGMRVRVIRRPNGGPGAARNTALDSLDPDTDFVALIDSDDTWRRDHLQRALSNLGPGCDVYFSDHLKQRQQQPHLPTTRFYQSLHPTPADANDVLRVDAASIAEFVVGEYLAHTSSIVYRASKLGAVRMSETLRAAGEDHLFFLDLVLAAETVCVSLACEVDLGAGVNIYDSAFVWGSERDLRRRTFLLAAQKMMRRRSDWTIPTRHMLTAQLRSTRRTIGFLLLRKLLSERKIPIDSMRLAWAVDRTAILFAPAYALSFVALRLFGRGFADKLK